VDEVLEALRMSPLAGRRPDLQCVPDGCAGLLEQLGHGPIGFDALAAASGALAASLNSQLLVLELAGLVERLPGGAIQRVVA
jgi:DNA processing protein